MAQAQPQQAIDNQSAGVVMSGSDRVRPLSVLSKDSGYMQEPSLMPGEVEVGTLCLCVCTK